MTDWQVVYLGFTHVPNAAGQYLNIPQTFVQLQLCVRVPDYTCTKSCSQSNFYRHVWNHWPLVLEICSFLEIAQRLRKTFDLQCKLASHRPEGQKSSPVFGEADGQVLLGSRYPHQPDPHPPGPIFVTLWGFTRSQEAKTSFLSGESRWTFIFSVVRPHCSFVPSPNYLHKVTLLCWSVKSCPPWCQTPTVPQDRRRNTAILLASVAVLKFVLSLQVQLNIGARNVHFHGFEPREDYEPTGQRLKPNNQRFEFCAFSFHPLWCCNLA